MDFVLSYYPRNYVQLNVCYRGSEALFGVVFDAVYGKNTIKFKKPTENRTPIELYEVTTGAELKERSYFNREHVPVIARICETLVPENQDQRVINTVILTPYVAQKLFLQESLPDARIPVFTIDSFLGKQADNVIISLPSNHLGFLTDEIDKTTSMMYNRRMLVMATRAKKRIVVVSSLFTIDAEHLVRKFLYDNASVIKR
ncbi:hypothetical protein L596_030682 [Steinernema carpocapsae]|uniref:DNA2/NAM7 helicase-like C-terminal domain-containing protein n=1 Tax=Steinernema carpocapsae TaxID=34508 RepID=A0A4U5LQ63_STECR|nr:hypothetical protein L596_030682 [Steinernema carpocapsae]